MTAKKQKEDVVVIINAFFLGLVLGIAMGYLIVIAAGALEPSEEELFDAMLNSTQACINGCDYYEFYINETYGVELDQANMCAMYCLLNGGLKYEK